MPGITGLFDIGRRSLFATQAAIETTSNNIANVNTEGYNRRYVQLEETASLDYYPGQIGTGVQATQVLRYFDAFVEASYLDKSTMSSMYDSLFQNLQAVDSLFDESSMDGISSMMSTFFSSWQDVATWPNDESARQALLADSASLTNLLQQAELQMQNLQEQTNAFIQQDVNDANEIMQQIAAINMQISDVTVEGQNNANQLLDKRDSLVRNLADIMDVYTIDNGGSDYIVMAGSGQTLVDGSNAYELRFESPKTIEALDVNSTFNGELYVEGTSDFEYTFEVVADAAVGAAEFRVSMDGGQTWLKNADGTEMRVPVNDATGAVEFRGLTLWVGQAGNPSAAPVGADANLTAGDRFDVMAKSGLYWYENTSSFENITPLMYSNGEMDGSRVTGGTLGGQFLFRDNYVGRYRDKLDTLCSELAWNVNYLHSQGAGENFFTSVQGTYSVLDPTQALANDTSGLFYRDKLQSGSTMIYLYDANGNLLNSQGYALDFGAAAGQQNFDPATHSLQDVVDAINRTVDAAYTTAGMAVPAPPYASVSNNQLNIQASPSGREFGFGQDTTGLLAALGVNTFFQGTDAASIAVNPEAANNLNHINVGHINGAGEVNLGDNTTAEEIGSLRDKKLDIYTVFEGNLNQTLPEYYNSLMTSVGADTSSAGFNYDYQNALAQDLKERQESLSAVNLDEEMANLIKFQHSYSAAAKLITTADEMMQTLLGMK